MLSGYVPVTRRRRGPASKDQYGNPVPGQWENVALPPAVFAPATSTEPISAGQCLSPCPPPFIGEILQSM